MAEPLTTPDQRIAALGLVLPPAPAPIGNFCNYVLCGSQLFISGQGPVTGDGKLFTGKVGLDVSVPEAYDHARLVGLNLIAVMHHVLGDLARVARIVKLLGFVNAAAEFADHPRVINGCSDLLQEVFGDAGRHARSAVGVASLPSNITVEVEAIVEIRPPTG